MISPLKRSVTGRVKPWLASLTIAVQVICLVATFALPAFAQDIPEELRRRLQEQNDDTPQELRSPVDRSRDADPSEPSTSPNVTNTYLLTPSRIELDYRERLGTAHAEIEQFGYALFAAIGRQGQGPVGRVADSYVLGIGDEIVATFIGSTDRSIITPVDSEGRVVLPELRPVLAAGRRFGEFRQALKAQVAASLLGTEVFVSVGSTRQVDVLVLGEDISEFLGEISRQIGEKVLHVCFSDAHRH